MNVLEIISLSWSEKWLMAGICVSTVFFILILLVVVLHIFSVIAARTNIKQKETNDAVPSAPANPLTAGEPASADDAENENLAAVATAVHLFLSRAHDDESGVLTIHQTPGSGWHAVLNPRM